jgi:hypothetical protein
MGHTNYQTSLIYQTSPQPRLKDIMTKSADAFDELLKDS